MTPNPAPKALAPKVSAGAARVPAAVGVDGEAAFPDAGGALEARVGALVEAAGELAELRPDTLVGMEVDRLAEAVTQVGRVESSLAAAKATLVAAADRAGAKQQSGATSTAAWLAQSTGAAKGQARKEADRARMFRVLPATRNALASGAITAGHADQIVAAAKRGGLGSAADTEAILLDTAVEASPEQLREHIKRTERAIQDRSALAVRDNRNWARRSVRTWEDRDGMGHLHAKMDTESLAIARTFLQRFATPDPHGTPPEQRRSYEQQMADGFVDGMRLALSHQDTPGNRGPAAAIDVVIDADTLLAAAGLDRPEADHPELGDDPCAGGHGCGCRDDGAACPGGHVAHRELLRDLAREAVARQRTAHAAPGEHSLVGPIAPETIQRMFCDAEIGRLVFAGGSLILDVGRRTKQWTPAQRRAITARDGGCRWPGCDRPPEWSDIHHVRWWRRDHGPTTVDSAVMLCRSHHRHVHELGWTLRFDPDTAGVTVIAPTRRPDGRLRTRTSLPRGPGHVFADTPVEANAPERRRRTG